MKEFEYYLIKFNTYYYRDLIQLYLLIPNKFNNYNYIIYIYYI